MIMGGAISIDISGAEEVFVMVAKKLESLCGLVDILRGIGHLEEAPREHEQSRGLVL